MKAYLEFDLDNPDDRDEHNRVVQCSKAYAALWDIVDYLRTEDKYSISNTTEQAAKVEEIRDRVHEIIYDDNNLNLDELYR